jgi:hypothetical protein
MGREETLAVGENFRKAMPGKATVSLVHVTTAFVSCFFYISLIVTRVSNPVINAVLRPMNDFL